MLVRSARAGSADGLAELVERLTPLLLSQARFRLREGLPGVEPEDVLQEVWVRALPNLFELGERDGRHTPVLVRYLATTLLNLVNELKRSQIRARRAGSGGSSRGAGPAALPAETLGIVSRAIRRERDDALGRMLGDLDDEERELLVLRGIEQIDNKAVAALLGDSPNAVSLRYNRLLERLRGRLKGSVLEELVGE